MHSHIMKLSFALALALACVPQPGMDESSPDTAITDPAITEGPGESSDSETETESSTDTGEEPGACPPVGVGAKLCCASLEPFAPCSWNCMEWVSSLDCPEGYLEAGDVP